MFPWSLGEQVKKYTKTYLQKLQKPGFCLPAPGSFSQPAQALVEDCQVLVGLLHSATEKKVKDGSKAGKKSPKGQKKGKIGDERPSIKWSEAFHIFQSGLA